MIFPPIYWGDKGGLIIIKIKKPPWRGMGVPFGGGQNELKNNIKNIIYIFSPEKYFFPKFFSQIIFFTKIYSQILFFLNLFFIPIKIGFYKIRNFL